MKNIITIAFCFVKHPYPEELEAVLEKESNMNLTPYFDLLIKEGSR